MSLVERSEKNGVVSVTLNRPEKLNALSEEFIRELSKTFSKISSESKKAKGPRAVIVKSSSEKAFCVGADLAERLKMNETQVVKTLGLLGTLMKSLEEIPVPTLCVLNGAAFGGGLELALCCDLRLADPKALMGLTETSLAIIPGAGGTQRLARLVGVAKAKEWIFRAARLSATEAFEAGLLNKVVENPLSVAEAWAGEIASRGPVAIKAAKKAINQGNEIPNLKRALMVERLCYKKTLSTKDRFEGLKAFSEKRDPQYIGE